MATIPANRLGIPAKVLQGKVPKYRSVAQLYRIHLTQEVMRRINKAFWTKAKGGTDDLGNKWKDLSPNTHAYKPLSPMERKTFRINNNLSRGLLTPSQDRVWRRVYARTLARLEKRGVANPEKEAAERAWGTVKSQGARTLKGLNRKTDINIRTGRLVAATRPGTISNRRYYRPKDQQVDITPRSIRVSFRSIPYAAEVDRVRPVIPDDISRWVEEAHAIAIRIARDEYARIKNSTQNGRRLSKKRSTRRRRRNR